MEKPLLHLVAPPVGVTVVEQPPPWWEDGPFLALHALRVALSPEGKAPTRPPEAAEHARRALAEVLVEVEHTVRDYGRRVAGGETLGLVCKVYVYDGARVDVSLRIVERDAPATPRNVA